MLLTFYIYRDSLLYHYILNSLRIYSFPCTLRTLAHWPPIILFLALWIKLRFLIQDGDVYKLQGPLLHQTGSILYHESSIWYFCDHNQWLCGHSFLSWDKLIRHNLLYTYNHNSIRNYNLPLRDRYAFASRLIYSRV